MLFGRYDDDLYSHKAVYVAYGGELLTMVQITAQDLAKAKPQNRPELFTGEVVGQTIVSETAAPNQRVAAISFLNGARNAWHRHTTEQVVVVTHGRGIVADSHGEHPITVGDVVLVAPNERHWHGATPGDSMTHLSILLPSVMTIADDENDGN